MLGLDIAIGEVGWAAGVEARYLKAEHDDLTHGPWRSFSSYWIGAGISYRVDKQ